MKRLLLRAWSSPVLLVILVISSIASAVDPIDFLESLKDDEDVTQQKETSSTEYPNGVNVIPGEPDLNYPTYSSIPKSSFSCIGRPVGFYADTELRCQVWHICDEDRRQQSFLCTNGTVYSQEKRVCDWWYNVNCDPNEVSRNYLQNYDLYKDSPQKSDNEQEQKNEGNKNNNNNNRNDNENGNDRNNERNDFDYQPTTKSYNKDPFSQFPSSRKTTESQQKSRYNNNNNDNDRQYSKPTPSYEEPFPTRESSYSNNNDFPTPRRQPPSSPHTRPSTTPTTTYRPPNTYSTPPPPAALQGSSFPPQRSHQQQSQYQHSQQQQKQQSQAQTQYKPPQQQQQKQPQQPTTPPPRTQPSIKTSTTGGKRIVEIRVPVSQIPPEILAKYGKRIPENILKEIFLNFTRGQQQELQKEAIDGSKPNNPTGAGNSRSSPPSAPIPPNRSSGTPPPPPAPKKPVDYGSNDINHKPSYSGSPKSPPPPPPPSPVESHYKFRHSTPRRVDGIKFATPTRELLAEYEDERQQVGESQNPIYSLQQLYNSHQPRTSAKSKAPPANDFTRVKDSFDFEPSPTTTPQPYQEYSRSQPRRRTQSPATTTLRTTTPYRPTTTPYYRTTTTEEPELITDRYFPVASPEEKKNAELKRILLVAKQGIKVLPPIPVLSGFSDEAPTGRRVPPLPQVTQRPHKIRTTAVPDFSRIPPLPKVSIPDDYYVQNERFEEAESRYPRPSNPPSYIEPQSQFTTRQYSRPTTTSIAPTTTTTTTTVAPPTPPKPFYHDPSEFRRTKPSKPQQQNKKKPIVPQPESKKQYDNADYDDSIHDRGNTDEIELLRLAQEYIELTGQDFGVRKTPRNA